MMQEAIHVLVASCNRGRYALDDGEHGHDLTTGEPIAIFVGGHWIEGRVEGSYVSTERLVSGTYVIDAPGHRRSLASGYYFVASSDGSICGLCVGMKIKLSHRMSGQAVA